MAILSAKKMEIRMEQSVGVAARQQSEINAIRRCHRATKFSPRCLVDVHGHITGNYS
jgi:hypothetical protein